MVGTRKFDTEEVLGIALHAFWRDGYTRTSIPQLERETGIGRQSLYLAFGDKKQLFLQALDRYVDQYIGRSCRILETLPPAEALAAVFDLIFERMDRPENPRGCLVTNTTLEVEGADHEIEKSVVDHLRRLEEAFRAALGRGVADRSLEPMASIEDEALMLMAATRGLSVLHRGGYRPEDLVAIRVQSLARLGLSDISVSSEIPASASG